MSIWGLRRRVGPAGLGRACEEGAGAMGLRRRALAERTILPRRLQLCRDLNGHTTALAAGLSSESFLFLWSWFCRMRHAFLLRILRASPPRPPLPSPLDV